MGPPALRGVLPVLAACAVLAVLQLALGGLPFFVTLASMVGINVILAVSLNVVNGMTGQFSIGHAGFMAVGAYVAARVSMLLDEVAISGLPESVSNQVLYAVALLSGGVAAAACGFVVGLPSLRLRGDYLAIVTLGFGEIVRVVIQNTPSQSTPGFWAMGGSLGLTDIPSGRSSLFAIWLWAFLVVLVARRIAESSHGRSLTAIREDEVAAEAMGVNTTAYKVRAFVVSSFFAGVAGGLFAHFYETISPGSFTYVRSMEIVVMVVAGGLGSTTGSIVAAVFLTLLPEALRSGFLALGGQAAAQVAEQVRMPIYGMLLVVLMLARPQGLFGTKELWHRRKAQGAAP